MTTGRAVRTDLPGENRRVVIVGSANLDLLRYAEPLIANRHEALAILRALGVHAATPAQALATLAAVHVVDTTGAGNAFAGSLVAALALGASFEGAMRRAGATATRLLARRRDDR